MVIESGVVSTERRSNLSGYRGFEVHKETLESLVRTTERLEDEAGYIGVRKCPDLKDVKNN